MKKLYSPTSTTWSPYMKKLKPSPLTKPTCTSFTRGSCTHCTKNICFTFFKTKFVFYPPQNKVVTPLFPTRQLVFPYNKKLQPLYKKQVFPLLQQKLVFYALQNKVVAHISLQEQLYPHTRKHCNFPYRKSCNPYTRKVVPPLQEQLVPPTWKSWNLLHWQNQLLFPLQDKVVTLLQETVFPPFTRQTCILLILNEVVTPLPPTSQLVSPYKKKC